jgi:hypothetical protein
MEDLKYSFNDYFEFGKQNLKPSFIHVFKKNASYYIKYMKHVFAASMPIDKDQFLQSLLADYRESSEVVYSVSEKTMSNYLYLLSARYFKEHKNELKEYLEKYDSEEGISFDDDSLDANLIRYVFRLMKVTEQKKEDCLAYFEGELHKTGMREILEDDEFSAKYKMEIFNRVIYSLPYNSAQRMKMTRELKKYLFGPIEVIDEDERELSKAVKDELASSLVQIINKLKDFGRYEDYEKKQIEHFRHIGFPKEYFEASYDIEKAPGIIQSLPEEYLFALNSFYMNRFAKELNSYAQVLFTISDLGLLERVPRVRKSNELFKGISDEEIMNVIIKYGLLISPTSQFIREKKAKLERKEWIPGAKFNKKTNSFTFSTTELQELMEQKLGYDYSECFKNKIPHSKNSIYDDIGIFAELHSPKMTSYHFKMNSINSISINFDKMANAGIVITDIKDGKALFTKYVLAGVDGPFTSPIFEHFDFEFFKTFYKKYTSNSIVPLYRGFNDFNSVYNKVFSTFLVLPTSDKQRKMLEDILSTNNYQKFYKNAVEHYNYMLNNSKVPSSFGERNEESVEEEIIFDKTKPLTKAQKKRLKTQKNKKNQIVLYPKEYVDLDTGSFYIKDKDGNYIEIQPDDMHFLELAHSQTDLIYESKKTINMRNNNDDIDDDFDDIE